MLESSGGLTRPSVTVSDAERIVRERWGIDGRATELGSNQDRNFIMTTKEGARFVLRVDNEVFPQSARDAQHAAIAAYAQAGVPVPEMIPGTDGELTQEWNGYAVRLAEFIAGETMVDLGYFAPQVLRSFGTLAAASVRALAPLDHAGLSREHQWDLRLGYEETMRVSASITDAALRERVERAAAEAYKALATVAVDLPVQAIHGDLTDDNVMGRREADSRVHPHTLIDFGDLSLGWRIAEAAVMVTSMLPHTGSRPLHALHAVEAFAETLAHAGAHLSQAEAEALWPLVTLRAALLVASAHRQLELEPDNAYARERLPGEIRMFEQAVDVPLVEMREQVLATVSGLIDVTGVAESAPVPALVVNEGEPLRALIPELVGTVAVLDPGVESPELDAGAWLHPHAEVTLIEAAFERGATATVFPHGVFRLTRSRVNTHDTPATWPIDTDIHVRLSDPLRVTAPIEGTVAQIRDDSVSIDLDGWILDIDGLTRHADTVTVGDRVAFGEPLGWVEPGAAPHGTLSVGIRRSDAPHLGRENAHPGTGTGTAARFVAPDRVPGVRALTLDPAPLLGLSPRAQEDESRSEQKRRERIFAAAQERYYERPMQIERGWRHYLVDTTGRAYIDMVNNVTGLGHGHSGVAEAVNRQIRLLGTNSRFLYRNLAEYSERLLELLPKGSGLDTVLLVNSGSEAVDLALRLAQAATNRKTIVALREAYHGWTMASDAVTTSAFDNPYALDSRPDWVHIADVPNTYRGTYRGDGAGERYLADLERDLADLAERGTPVAGFICESVLGNAGGVTLPEGYLARAYELIRRAGGVAIADEVQVGFGRMGTSFWGFEQSGVLPDIIAIAKPMGNGFPIGGVITSKRIADALSSQGQFFSSAGGNPVSCAAGLAVLDAMRDERLQDNARIVGAHLIEGFERLRQRHPLIGPIHGTGLYLGVELVRDHGTLEPATAEADAICERLRELGVIVLTTSERSNVLKIKPPLCLTIESADTVLNALDRVLTEGW